MKKIEMLRWIVGILSIAFIIFLWIQKAMNELNTSLSLALKVTSLLVTLCKIALIGCIVLLGKIIINKIKK